jgi:hypothetical protein
MIIHVLAVASAHRSREASYFLSAGHRAKILCVCPFRPERRAKPARPDATVPCRADADVADLLARQGPGRYKSMMLKPAEFIRRFLIHVLPNGFHRIRRYGLLASGTKTETIARAQKLIG